MASPRTRLAVLAAKAAAVSSRALGRGGGTAVAGLVGLWIQPALVRDLAAGLGKGSVLVTGTNGKTTTARLIAATARAAGLRPLANASGSNLMRGIASALAAAARPTGSLGADRGRLGVFEVDEATLPAALRELRPRAVVFTNLFRDQLDRYGEVEAVASLWREALGAAADVTLVLNADDPAVAALGEGRDRVVYFGINDPARDSGCQEHAADARFCPCGTAFQYGVSYFGHLGHWRCPNCGRSRPPTQVTARDIDLAEGRRLRFTLGSPAQPMPVEMALGGLYNVYNALAATAAALALGLPQEAALAGLRSVAAAFGRQETFDVDGREVEVLLGKNPAGLNQVLATLALDPEARSALLILNDRIADGRDISWIWDADFEVAAGRFDSVVVSGTRAEEMALRLKYAGWDESRLVIARDIATAVRHAIGATPSGGRLSVVPTYTAMLEVRGLLARRAGRRPFWEAPA